MSIFNLGAPCVCSTSSVGLEVLFTRVFLCELLYMYVLNSRTSGLNTMGMVVEMNI